MTRRLKVRALAEVNSKFLEVARESPSGFPYSHPVIGAPSKS